MKRILVESSFDISDQKMLFFCVREFICELMNHGISKAYLYTKATEALFSEIEPEDDIKYILGFLNKLKPYPFITADSFDDLDFKLVLLKIKS